MTFLAPLFLCSVPQMVIYSCCSWSFPLQVSTSFSGDFLPRLASLSSLLSLRVQPPCVSSGIFVPYSFRDRHLHKAAPPTVLPSEHWHLDRSQTCIWLSRYAKVCLSILLLIDIPGLSVFGYYEKKNCGLRLCVLYICFSFYLKSWRIL